jgi:hypothetical protein
LRAACRWYSFLAQPPILVNHQSSLLEFFWQFNPIMHLFKMLSEISDA